MLLSVHQCSCNCVCFSDRIHNESNVELAVSLVITSLKRFVLVIGCRFSFASSLMQTEYCIQDSLKLELEPWTLSNWIQHVLLKYSNRRSIFRTHCHWVISCTTARWRHFEIDRTPNCSCDKFETALSFAWNCVTLILRQGF